MSQLNVLQAPVIGGGALNQNPGQIATEQMALSNQDTIARLQLRRQNAELELQRQMSEHTMGYNDAMLKLRQAAEDRAKESQEFQQGMEKTQESRAAELFELQQSQQEHAAALGSYQEAMGLMGPQGVVGGMSAAQQADMSARMLKAHQRAEYLAKPLLAQQDALRKTLDLALGLGETVNGRDTAMSSLQSELATFRAQNKNLDPTALAAAWAKVKGLSDPNADPERTLEALAAREAAKAISAPLQTRISEAQAASLRKQGREIVMVAKEAYDRAAAAADVSDEGGKAAADGVREMAGQSAATAAILDKFGVNVPWKDVTHLLHVANAQSGDAYYGDKASDFLGYLPAGAEKWTRQVGLKTGLATFQGILDHVLPETALDAKNKNAVKALKEVAEFMRDKDANDNSDRVLDFKETTVRNLTAPERAAAWHILTRMEQSGVPDVAAAASAMKNHLLTAVDKVQGKQQSKYAPLTPDGKVAGTESVWLATSWMSDPTSVQSRMRDAFKALAEREGRRDPANFRTTMLEAKMKSARLLGRIKDARSPEARRQARAEFDDYLATLRGMAEVGPQDAAPVTEEDVMRAMANPTEVK